MTRIELELALCKQMSYLLYYITPALGCFILKLNVIIGTFTVLLVTGFYAVFQCIKCTLPLECSPMYISISLVLQNSSQLLLLMNIYFLFPSTPHVREIICVWPSPSNFTSMILSRTIHETKNSMIFSFFNSQIVFHYVYITVPLSIHLSVLGLFPDINYFEWCCNDFHLF